MSSKFPPFRPQLGLKYVLKANPYHDETGRFSTKDKANFVSVGGVFDRQSSRVSEKEKTSTTATYASEAAKLVAGGAVLKVGGMEVSPEVFAESWAATVPGNVSPTELTNAVLGKGSAMTGIVFRLHPEDKKLQVNSTPPTSAEVHGAKAKYIERTFKFDQGDAHHDYLKLEPTSQGGSAIKKMFAECVPVYKKMGMTQISTFANLDAGGYAWARYGFREDYRGAVADEITEGFSQIKKILAKNKVTLSKEAKEEWGEATLTVMTLGRDDYAPMHLTNIRTPKLDAELAPHFPTLFPKGVTFTTVKAALNEKSWMATLKFNDSVSMTALSTYVGKKL